MLMYRPPWMLMLWMGLSALFLAVSFDSAFRTALSVSGLLWSVIASAALYREQGGSAGRLMLGSCLFLAIMVFVFTWPWPYWILSR